MKNPYGRREWRTFRSDIIRIYDGVCNRCQRGPDDGVVLQVHHKIYFPKRLPWQYRYDECEALCRGCHAQEHGKVMPKPGWEHFGFCDDLGGLDGNCEYCNTPIRYVFPIHHPKWGTMEVGEYCCDDLTSTTFATEHMKRMDRRSRFVSSTRWFTNKQSEPCIIQKNIRVTVVPDGPQYRLRMDGKLGKLKFGSELEAKIMAFDVIDSGRASAYLIRAEARATHHQRSAHHPG